MIPIYFIADSSIPLRDVFDASASDPVAHALPFWERMGLGCVVANHGGRIAASASNGPDHTSGLWIAVWPEHGSAPKPFGIHLTKQDWVKVRNAKDGSAAIYVGWTKDQPPTEQDISNGNPHSVSGPTLKLCDGCSWTVPEIREPISGGYLMPTDAQQTGLPTLIKRDLDGNLCRPVKPRFEALWELSGTWFDTWCELHFTERNTFSSEAALDFCLQVLQLRYRIPDVLNDALGLLDTNNFQQIIEAAIGWPPVRQLLEERLGLDDDQKKNHGPLTPELPSGNSGPEACDNTTGRPAANNTSPQTPAADYNTAPPQTDSSLSTAPQTDSSLSTAPQTDSLLSTAGDS